MNRSWNKDSGSSPGFVYFNQQTQKECDDSTDFLAFQESPSKNYRHSSNYGSPKFHSSPRQFNTRNNYRYSGRNRGNRSYNSPNNSYHKSWNNQNSSKHHYSKGSFNNSLMMSADGKRDMSMFYDHTCTTNPWEDLEKELEVTRAVEKKSQLALVTKKEDVDGQSKKQEQSSSSGDEESKSNSDESSSSEPEEETT